MANEDHLNFLTQCIAKGDAGIKEWNMWREEHPEIRPDLSEAELEQTDLAEANLSKANLRGTALWEARLYKANFAGANLKSAFLLRAFADNANFTKADLRRANLRAAELSGADFTGAKLSGADLIEAELIDANLTRADLTKAALIDAVLIEANLNGANLNGAALRESSFNQANLSNANLEEADLWQVSLNRANLSGANLHNARLDEATLIQTDLTKANLTDCSIYGISAWDIALEETKQLNLIITPPDQPEITVDNLEVAQFIYLLLHNQKIRSVIDTITSKVVLILGRFTPERKIVLDILREELRKHNYSPVVFDFEKPASKDLTETVSTLAHMSRFIIADLTDPSSIPYELATIVPHCVVPVVPLLVDDETRQEFAMFKDLGRRYSWVLPIYRYTDQDRLLASIKDHIITPAEEKARELGQKK